MSLLNLFLTQFGVNTQITHCCRDKSDKIPGSGWLLKKKNRQQKGSLMRESSLCFCSFTVYSASYVACKGEMLLLGTMYVARELGTREITVLITVSQGPDLPQFRDQSAAAG